MTHRLSTLLYSLKLALTLTLTLSQVSWLKIPFMVRLFSIFTIVSVLVTGVVVTTVPAHSYVETVSTSTPPHTELFAQQSLSKAQLQEKLAVYQKLLQSQPHHRDILINAALTAKALGDEATFNNYWNQAKTVDPNYPVFN